MAEKQSLGLTRKLAMRYEDAVEAVTAALKEEGFGILTEVDVKETLQKKLDTDFRKYVILGACNPSLAHKALSTELEMGLLLPCNTIVYEDGDESVVSIFDPKMMVQIANNEELASVAAEASERLQRALDTL